MVYVPAGKFLMGSTAAQIDAEYALYRNPRFQDDTKKVMQDNEMPQRKIYLDGYWIYKNWRYVKERDGLQIVPVWRGM